MKSQFSLRRTLLLLLVVLAVLLPGLWGAGLLPLPSRGVPQNSLLVITPYRAHGTWVFDDARVGLVQEPFVAGIPEMIDVLVADIPQADQGFRMTFSAQEFPCYDKRLTWNRREGDGNWYTLDDPPMEGWICPALLKYYDDPPQQLYVRADPLPAE